MLMFDISNSTLIGKWYHNLLQNECMHQNCGIFSSSVNEQNGNLPLFQNSRIKHIIKTEHECNLQVWTSTISEPQNLRNIRKATCSQTHKIRHSNINTIPQYLYTPQSKLEHENAPFIIATVRTNTHIVAHNHVYIHTRTCAFDTLIVFPALVRWPDLHSTVYLNQSKLLEFTPPIACVIIWFIHPSSARPSVRLTDTTSACARSTFSICVDRAERSFASHARAYAAWQIEKQWRCTHAVAIDFAATVAATPQRWPDSLLRAVCSCGSITRNITSRQT